MLQLEPLTEGHLDGMLELWNGELTTVFPMRKRLLVQNILDDRNWLRDGSWVAREERTGAICGFVVSKIGCEDATRLGISRDLGWIHALMVGTAWRRRGIGQALLDKAEKALRATGASRIALGNDLYGRLFPGVPDMLIDTKIWFEKRGYVLQGQVFDLLNVYNDDEKVELPLVRHASFRMASMEDREALTAFMARCFPGSWDYQHRDYWERGGTGREFVLLERDGEIIGFCRINDAKSPLLAQNVYWAPLFHEELGGIGPLGIDESFRGNQYGISIVQAAVHYLLQRGVRRIVIDTTPFIDFYGKLGYTSWRSYSRYGKTIT